MNIFNYYLLCNELKNMKEILFEDYNKHFLNIKPSIEVNETGIKILVNQKDTNQNNRLNSSRSDRILANLFDRLEKQGI